MSEKNHFAQKIDPEVIEKFHAIAKKVGIKPGLLLEKMINFYSKKPYDTLINMLFLDKK